MKQTGTTRTMLICALLAGALGGAASARLWPTPPSAMAAQPQSLASITARQFEMMDDKGNVRGRLSVSGEGIAQLGMYDELGVERATLAVTKDGSTMLAMSGDSGDPRLAMNLATHNGPAAVSLRDADGSVAAEMINSGGKREILLADSHTGHARVSLALDTATGQAAISIYDRAGKLLKKIPEGSR
jgi:hypothetical protein